MAFWATLSTWLLLSRIGRFLNRAITRSNIHFKRFTEGCVTKRLRVRDQDWKQGEQ